ncbi:alpha-amylase [Pedobacter sp. LMG 31464]|uniref:Alpha-amylase n=1 Tax=Pedobacter planticolens TaxID=2679964 RepID=A0A923IWQ4_9SPHI|nr:alpha-amylase [Pedobacter planticolens]MBB2145452.1 alpha-amylase [Pedobacter planticolens]
MQNQTLIQYFHWYYNEKDNLWTKAKNEAANLSEMGFTAVWLPPAYKGSSGGYSIGYDAYDLYDLGEFDQKNSIDTKYGNKDQYIAAINALHANNISVLADTVFNHKAGGDELEKVKVKKVNPLNRNEFISDEFEIEAWTKFTFPGRQGKYSAFLWDYQCFSGVDWAQDINESAIFEIQNGYGESWEKVAGTELGNYDYLMFDDIDFRNPSVKQELINWGKWYHETCKIDGFRLDAVKHISPEFVIEWLDELKKEFNRDFFVVSENWNIASADDLEHYIEITGGRTQLFDSLLHHNFYLASTGGKDYNMSSIFDNTLVQKNPELAVTFVDNHDSQPLQALESFIDFWFRPLAYALILLREQGIPCVFFTDIYGANYEDKGKTIELVALSELPQLLKARQYLAYGEQHDYLDHNNCIGWTRKGDEEHPNSGIVVLMSNGEEGFKAMEMGKYFSGKTFIDSLEKRKEEVLIDENGFGEFFCNAGSVSVWTLKVQ